MADTTADEDIADRDVDAPNDTATPGPDGTVVIPDTEATDLVTTPDTAVTDVDIPDSIDDSGPSDTNAPDDGGAVDSGAGDGGGPCPNGLQCFAGWCVSRPDEGQCVTNADCPGISTCDATAPGGVCGGCGSDNDCPGSAECTPFGACAETCDAQNPCVFGRCAANGYCALVSCSNDSQCKVTERCADGRCRRIACPNVCQPNPCTEPGRGVCSPEIDGFTCTCNPGLVPNPDGPGCIAEVTSGCAGGFSCIDGLCVDRTASGFQCATNSDCGGARTCSPALPSGICQGCSSAADCPAGHDTCLANRCFRNCITSNDCHAGMVCTAQGVCGQKTCTANADCPAAYVCSPTGDPRRCVRATCN